MSQTLQPSHGASSTGLAPNIAGALAYLFAPIGGIVFFLIEKEDAYVRFHAAQAIVFGALLIALGVVLNVLLMVAGFIPGLGGLLSSVLGLLMMVGIQFGGFVAWAVLTYMAFSGKEYEAPFIAPYARQLTAKSGLS